MVRLFNDGTTRTLFRKRHAEPLYRFPIARDGLSSSVFETYVTSGSPATPRGSAPV